MKFNIPKEWILRKAKEEMGLEITAGNLERYDSNINKESTTREINYDLVAFSTLINLLRRKQRIEIAELATRTRIDAIELERIECDISFMPKPRTVHQLAMYFNLPEARLFELSNLTATKTPDMHSAAIQFAAKAGRLMELDQEERNALNEFVKFLSNR
jgi:transcriptional regulator with XRE-family HTH domain